MSRVPVTLVLCFMLIGCGESDPSETPEYQAGYSDGLEDGKAASRSQMCSQIERLSDSIHTAVQNEGICG